MERIAKIGPGGKAGTRAKPSSGETQPSPFRKAVVFGATGSIGRVLVKELLERGVPTRVVSRSITSLRRNFAEDVTEFHPADIRDPDAATRAADGCDMIFHCVGVPLHDYDDHILMARSLCQAMVCNHARCLCATGYWSYMPIASNPIREEHPRRPESRLAKLRQLQEDIMVNAGACVAMLPDFFGPGASSSMLNDAIAAIARGKAAHWPGDPEAPRDFLFIPDAGRPLLELTLKKESFARRVNLPGSGPTQPRQLLEFAAQRLGESLRLRAAPLWMVKLAGSFNRKHRDFVDIFPLYDGPAFMDGHLARQLIGDYHTTAYPQAMDRTVRWMTSGAELAAA